MFPIAARYVHPDAGYEIEQKRVAELLTLGEVYTVTHLDVGRSHSVLYLEGFSYGFNTVFFEPAELPGFELEHDDRGHDVSDELSEVRTILGRTESAIKRLEQCRQQDGEAHQRYTKDGWQDYVWRADPDIAEMTDALGRVVSLLGRWRKAGTTRRDANLRDAT